MDIQKWPRVVFKWNIKARILGYEANLNILCEI